MRHIVSSLLLLVALAASAQKINLGPGGNVKGTLQAPNCPALTGDTTAPANTCITTTVRVNGVTYPANPSVGTVPVVTGANVITYQALPPGTGTVTSVGLTVNSTSPSGIFTVTGSPVTTSGSLNLNLAGTSGGVPYFSSSTALSSSGLLSTNNPVIGGGSGAAPTSGTRSGTTTKFATVTGATTTGDLATWDVNGNLQDGGTGGGGSVVAASQYSLPYYSAVGTSNAISGVTGPTGPNNVPQFLISVPASGLATAPITAPAGVQIRTVIIGSDSILATDRTNWVVYNNGSAIAVTLPQASSTGFASNFVTRIKNIGAGTATITPTTSTIDGGATLVVTRGQNCTISSDNTNYTSNCASGQVTAGSGITITPGANGISIAATGGGAITGSGLVSTQVAVATSSSALTSYAGFTSDSSGNVIGLSFSTPSGSVAGRYLMGQGSAASLGTNSVGLTVPASVTSYNMKFPGAAGSGLLTWLNSSNLVTGTFTDLPDVKIIPAANCVNGTAGSGWSSTSTGMPAACRAGSNNFNGVLSPIPSTGGTAYLDYELPGDWDTATKPFVSIYYASGANTAGTVIWTVSTACTKQDGSVTDDPAWIAESAMGTQTMAVANRMWAQNAQLAGAMTNCIAGSTMFLKLVVSGTAASAINVSKLVVTAPRLPVVQAD